MSKSTKFQIFLCVGFLTGSAIAQPALSNKNVTDVGETPSYSLEKLCRKSGKMVIWLGSLNNSKKLALKGLSVEDALNKVCVNNVASYSYDNDRFVFRKLDFVELMERPNFGGQSLNESYRILASAPDNALRLMLGDYEKEVSGAMQEGAPFSQFNPEGRLFSKAIAQRVFDYKSTEATAANKESYSISASLYHTINWVAGKSIFVMNDWRSTAASCSPDHKIVWADAEKEVEKFEGTLEEAIRYFGPYNDFTIDLRIKNSHLLLFYPKGMTKQDIFAQMKNDMPFKSRELAGKTHIFSNNDDVVTYRLLTLGDRLYNKAGSCGYDAWQQFAYRSSSTKIAELSASQRTFVNEFIKNHNTNFPEDKIPLSANDDSLEKGSLSFVPEININVMKKEVALDGKANVLTHELVLSPSN